ncbi:MAG: serine/threonine protein kinase [Acidobacteria bacterium]|nr:serine/threonine protein kinase [Acidobacteriota bacterium]
MVYAGFDEKLERKVAVKSIHGRLNRDPDMKSRFLREARMLSQLDHAHICAIHDYLETGLGDFLVLEFIEGQTLKEVIEHGQPGHDKALAIAIQLGDALKAAHAKGVVHRDFKPANVMVNKQGQVKVLDFGLAYTSGEADFGRIEASSTDQFETQASSIIGTLGYLSPEQARSEPATSLSDIYSLGLVMQELFTGQPAMEPGLAPNIRLLQASKAQTRPIEDVPSDIKRLIERMKALEPAARPSASEVLRELLWIQNAPKRRLKKQMMVTGFVVMITLLSIMTFQAFRISQEAQRANAEAARANREAEAARQVSDFMVGLFEVSDPRISKGESVTALQLLQAGTDRVSTELTNQPLIAARFLYTIGRVKHNLGLYHDAQVHFEESLELRKSAHAEPSEIIEAMVGLAESLESQGQFAEAEAMTWTALCMRIPSLKQPNLSVDHERDEALSQLAKVLPTRASMVEKSMVNILGTIYYRTGRHKSAGLLFELGTQLTRDLVGQRSIPYAKALHNLAAVRRLEGRLDESEQLYKQSLEVKQEILGEDHFELAQTLNNLAIVYSSQGRYDDAEPMYERALAIKTKVWGVDHPKVASSQFNLAMNYKLQGKYDLAEPLFRRDLEVSQKTRDANHPYVLEGMRNLAEVWLSLNRNEDAAALLDDALTRARKANWADPSPQNAKHFAEILIDWCKINDHNCIANYNEAVSYLDAFVSTEEDQDVMGYYTTFLLRLGDLNKARSTAHRLLKMEWGGSEFQELCRAHGIQ